MHLSTPHISNGKVLLKNVSNNLWYYVDLLLSEGNVYLRNFQVATTVDEDAVDYAEYFTLQSPTMGCWKMFLYNIESSVHYGLSLLDPAEAAYRLFLKEATTGVTYEVKLAEFEGNVYAGINDVSTSTNIIELPWRTITAGQLDEIREIVPGSIKNNSEVVIYAS